MKMRPYRIRAGLRPMMSILVKLENLGTGTFPSSLLYSEKFNASRFHRPVCGTFYWQPQETNAVIQEWGCLWYPKTAGGQCACSPVRGGGGTAEVRGQSWAGSHVLHSRDDWLVAGGLDHQDELMRQPHSIPLLPWQQALGWGRWPRLWSHWVGSSGNDVEVEA